MVDEPPPQPIAVTAKTIASIMNNAALRLRMAGMPNRSSVASAAPGNPNFAAGCNAALLEAVVATVTVVVAAEVPLTVTDAGIVQVGGSFGLEMLVVTAQEKSTSPVNPLAGVTVMVEVLPVVAPGAMVIAPPLVSANEPLPPLDPPVMVRFNAVDAVILPVVASAPVTVTT